MGIHETSDVVWDHRS